MIQVVLDTNFMYLPFQKKVDIYKLLSEGINEPFELIAVSPCIDELSAMSKAAAELAKKRVKTVNSEGPADDAIIKFSRGKNVIVCTQDRELKKKLRGLGVRILSFSYGRLR